MKHVFKIEGQTQKKYHEIIAHPIGNWVIETVNSKGALIIKKGSWRMNRRLWRPRYYIPKGGRFPEAIPKYVREAVKEAWKLV